MKDTWSEFNENFDEKDFAKYFGYSKYFPVIFAILSGVLMLIESIAMFVIGSVAMGVLFLVLAAIVSLIVYVVMKISISYNILHIVYLRKLMTMNNKDAQDKEEEKAEAFNQNDTL